MQGTSQLICTVNQSLISICRDCWPEIGLWAPPKAALRKCSFKKVFRKYVVNLQENTLAKVGNCTSV